MISEWIAKKNRNLGYFEKSMYGLNFFLSLMGFVMMISMFTFVGAELGELQRGAKIAGMTTGFMAIFSLVTFCTGFCGMYLTYKRDIIGWAYTGYGFCLFWFIMIPLFVVGVGSAGALTISEDRLKGICAINGTNSEDQQMRQKYLGDGNARFDSLSRTE